MTAVYEAAPEADILLDLHSFHRQYRPLPHPSSNSNAAAGPLQVPVAASHSDMQYGTHQGYASSAYAPETTEPPSSTSSRHGHSLSLGQIPHSTTSTTSTTGYAAPRGQTAQQHQQQHAIPSHARSFSASASTSSSNNTNNAANSSPYLSPYMAAATTSTSAGGDSNNSNPASRTQTISPLMGHAHLGQYSQGLGLAGVPATASHASSSATAPMYPPYIQQQQSQHSSMPAYTSNLHGTITPPSPSTGHASSLRHSFSDNAGASLPYTPQSYTSGSSLPSSYNTLASSKHQSSYDAHSLSSLPSSYGHHHHHQYSSTYPPYPLSHSAQGFMTVYTASPMYGCKDSQIHLEVGVAPHDPHYIRGFRVLFGSHGTTTRVVGETRAEGEERVDLVAITPPAHLTNRIPPNGSTCQLSLQALDEGGNVADWADLGVFEFTDVSSPAKGHKRPGSPLSSLRDSPNSTMRSVFPDNSPYPPPSNTSTTHKRGHSRGSSMGSLVNGFGYMSHASSSHSRNSSMASSAFGGAGGEYDQQLLHQSPQSGGNMLLPTSPDKNAVSSGGMGSVVPLGSSPVGQGGGTPGTVWYATPDGEMVERKPIARLRAPVQPPSSTPASSNLRHPPMEAADANTPTLYRTSQLPSVTMDGSSNIATKAVLKFDGDLNNMALGWSHDEWHAKRRLVLFTRSQEGGTINAAFRPVTLQEITPNTIVISCIFREDKNECYVTSVDTIYLLEALVSVRFTVEEKNRIRRNLEGYKPLTITKAKQDCEEFFKVIMGFPNPKPRNIEKDVKVFPWKILANALKKIISKYSASYLKPEEMVGPGKLPPQPIGWAPGRTPPPTATPLPSAAGAAGSSNNAFSQRPPGTAGSSSSLSMSPSMRNEMLPSSFHTSLSSSSLNNGLHTSTLDSVAEDEPMSPDSAAAAALANSTTTFPSSNNNRNGNHHNQYYQQEDDKTIIPEYATVPSDLTNLELAAAAAATAASGDNNFDPALMGPSTEGADELATPNANYENASANTDANPFRFS